MRLVPINTKREKSDILIICVFSSLGNPGKLGLVLAWDFIPSANKRRNHEFLSEHYLLGKEK